MNGYKTQHHLVWGGLLGLSAVIAGCGGGGGAAPGAATPVPVQNVVFTETPLGGTGGPTAFSSAVSINNNGMIVGNYDVGAIAATQLVAAKWDAAHPELPQVPLLSLAGGTNYSSAYGINDTNITVGESVDAGGVVKAVNWPAASTAAVILNQGALAGSNSAYSINAANAAVGEADVAGITVAILWPSLTAAPITLPHLDPANVSPASSAYFISSSGVIVGESRGTDGKMQGVVWLPVSGAYGVPKALAKLSPTQASSIALGVDAAGHIVGEAELADGVVHGMVWDTAGVMVNDLGAATSAQAVNNSDRIVGFVDAQSGAERATIWDRATVANKKVLAPVSQAFGINDASAFVGIKNNHAFIAIPQ